MIATAIIILIVIGGLSFPRNKMMEESIIPATNVEPEKPAQRVAVQPSIEILSPYGEEVWQIGNRYQFKWRASNTDSLIINLDNVDTGARYGVGFDKALNDTETLSPETGIMNWKVRDTNLPVGRYKVFMTALNGNLATYTSSSDYFIIVESTPEAEIVLNSPMVSDDWVMGYEHDINYFYYGPQATFNFAMYREGSLNRCFLGTGTLERGPFTFRLDQKINCGNGEYVTPGRYKIEILALPEDTSLISKMITSADYFNVVSHEKSSRE